MPCLILSGQQLQLAQGSGMKNTHFPRRHLLSTEQEQSHQLPVWETRGQSLLGMLDRNRGPPALLGTLILPDPQKGSPVRRLTVTAYLPWGKSAAHCSSVPFRPSVLWWHPVCSPQVDNTGWFTELGIHTENCRHQEASFFFFFFISKFLKSFWVYKIKTT